ncbi:AI-2E family transporter [Pseudodesulfovibrio piezophilus]|nr:AI-2E family transporter [Pseudodesulfovibrio piezophilus]
MPSVTDSKTCDNKGILMLDPNKPYTLDRVVRMVLSAGFVICLIWSLEYLATVLVPFVSALLMAYLLNPVTSAIEKKVGSRGVAVVVTVLGSIGFFVGIIWVVVPMMTSEIAHMGSVLQELVSNQEFAERVRTSLPPDLWVWVKNFAADRDIQDFFTSSGALAIAKGVALKVMPGITGVLRGTASLFTGILSLGVILLYLVFLLGDFGTIQKQWQNYLPKGYRQDATDFLEEFKQTMSHYFRGQVIIALLVGVLLSIGFLIIGLPLALVLGLFIGILNIAPYLGTIGLAPAVLLGGLSSLEAGDSPWLGIGLVLLVFVVVQALQEIVLIPRIQGEGLGLSPWMIILALSIWGKLLGFLGLLIALPVTCLLLSFYRRLIARRDKVMNEAGQG